MCGLFLLAIVLHSGEFHEDCSDGSFNASAAAKSALPKMKVHDKISFVMNDEQERFSYHFILAAGLLVCTYIILYRVLGQGLLSHSDYDAYTRQAAAWWQGQTYLPDNVTWLELAVHGGRYYVSFPPFPSVVQFLLFPLFGMNTPDNLVNTLFGLGSFVLIYRYMMRRGFDGLYSSLVALLMTLGSNLFYISLTGWVWFSAQTQGFFFSALAVCLIDSRRQSAWYFSFLCLGIAFTCRPMNIVYAPLLFYILYKNNESGSVMRTFVRCTKYILPLAAAGVCAAAYNHIRFGNIFEFGHNYLPEFKYAPQFALEYVPENFLEILKLPGAHNENFWPRFNGTLFFLVNPVYVLLAVRMVQRLVSPKRMLYLMCLIVHTVLILSHKTMGGWQFGCRYMIDMMPFMLFIIGDNEAKEGQKVNAVLTAVLLVVGIAVNLWGAVWYYTSF